MQITQALSELLNTKKRALERMLDLTKRLEDVLCINEQEHVEQLLNERHEIIQSATAVDEEIGRLLDRESLSTRLQMEKLLALHIEGMELNPQMQLLYDMALENRRIAMRALEYDKQISLRTLGKDSLYYEESKAQTQP